MTIDRRSLLQLSALLGIGLALPSASAPPTAVSAESAETLTVLVDAILPTTDTAGAVQAGVVPFVLLMVADWLDAPERKRFWDGYAAFEGEAVRRFGRPFAKLSPTERTTYLTDGFAVTTSPPSFLDLVKRLTVFGYYTSEIGASQELTYNMATDYQGAAPVDPAEHAPSLGRRFHTFNTRAAVDV
jgi:hypothetical protein